MSVTPSSTIVGIFGEQATAEQAMDALYNAGFEHEQIRYSGPGTSGGFFEDLKSLFTGLSATSGNVVNDLTDMGLSNEESQYYAHEHSNGKIVLAVKAPGREQEAQNIMHQYDSDKAQARTDSLHDTTNYAQQSSEIHQSQENVTPSESALPTPQETPMSSDANLYNAHTDVITPEHAQEPQTIQPMVADYNTNAQHQVTQRPDVQDAQPVVTEYNTEQQATHASDVQPMVVDYNAEPQAAQSLVDTSEYEPASQAPITNVTTPEQTTSQPSMGTSEHTDELQQLQAQIESLQQQLQDAKAQLQAAKEHETQLRTAKEREQQLQALRQKMQEIQAELEATHAELRDTHARIGQYQ
ncbi:MAG: hypothetical protein NVSMB38_43530 [Ktedonobacteraceae bacterium]